MTADPELARNLEARARKVRETTVRMIHRARSGHPGGALSAADLLTALYFHELRINPMSPQWPARDRFILSKGHACPVLYACLAERGFFPTGLTQTLRQIGSSLQGHPDMRKTPGVDMTTGSLGQGLSCGLGMALGARLAGADFRVFVLLGDGEINEGQVWEAAMAAGKFGLGNLVAIVDYNRLQVDGFVEQVMPLEPLAAKWRAFNWHVLEIDGHNMSEIIEAFRQTREVKERPSCIIAHTVKGKGVSFMENRVEWHGMAPNNDQLVQALHELGVS